MSIHRSGGHGDWIACLMPSSPMHHATRVVAAGRPPRTIGGPLNPPITLSTTFHAADADPDADWTLDATVVDYARTDVDTWAALESALGDLDGGHATVFASGMAAITATIDHALFAGGPVAMPRVIVTGNAEYSGTAARLAELGARGWAEIRRVDLTDGEQVAAALVGAHLVWVECPSNPLLDVADVAAISDAAHAVGAVVAVDATFATPLRMRPIELGADVTVHSATKMLSGHSDVLMGVAITADPATHEGLRRRRRSDGAVPGPFEAWLVLRGLRTLDVRLERAEGSATILAQRLRTHPRVTRVRYPGLIDDPGHATTTRQSSGPGNMIAVEVDGAVTAERVADACRVWTHATSLGGVESLIERRRRHRGESATVPKGLMRLSVGLEHVEDLWADLSGALDQA